MEELWEDVPNVRDEPEYVEFYDDLWRLHSELFTTR